MTDQWCDKCNHAEHELDTCGEADVDSEKDWVIYICRCPLGFNDE